MWDVAMNLKTGDWMFGPHRDILGTSGEDHIRQRIFTRLKIPRGTFAHDKDRTLGSDLYASLRKPRDRQLAEAAGHVFTALEPMEDLRITNVNVEPLEINQMNIEVEYSVISVGEEIEPAAPVDFSARVTV